MGFAIYRVKGAAYPGVIHSPGNETPGMLYSGIHNEQLRALDLFEGDLYERRYSNIITADANSHNAWVYLISESRKTQLTTEPWHLKSFMENDFDTFMNNYVNGRKDIYTKTEGK